MPMRRKVSCPRCGARVFQLPRHLRTTHRKRADVALQMSRDAKLERRGKVYKHVDGLQRCPFCGAEYASMVAHFRRNHNDIPKRKRMKELRRLRGKDVSSSESDEIGK